MMSQMADEENQDEQKQDQIGEEPEAPTLDPEQVAAYLATLDDPAEAERYLASLRPDVRRATKLFQEEERRIRQSVYDRFQRDQQLQRLTHEQRESIEKAQAEAERRLEEALASEEAPVSSKRQAMLGYQRAVEAAMEQRFADQMLDVLRRHPLTERFDIDTVDAIREANNKPLTTWLSRWLDSLIETAVRQERAKWEAEAAPKVERGKPKKEAPPPTGSGRRLPFSPETLSSLSDKEYAEHRSTILREVGRVLRGG